MSTDDRMETITDPAEIRASDEPDERGDFPCCTTPAPASGVALDLDAIEVRANVGSIWFGSREEAIERLCKIADDDVPALVAEVRRLTRLGQCDLDLLMRAEAAEAEVVTLRAKVAAVEAWPLTLEQVHAIVDYLLGDGSRDGLIHGDTLNRAMGASARRRAALATTGEGQ